MAYKSLYRSYRPQTFSEVIGQQHIVKTLQNAISRNQLAHAYLFTGSRGTGKTTIAKLLAKGINCNHPEKAPCNECEMCQAINQETHPDIIEIDAASNNGVDDVRDLIERVKYAPLQAKKKVYIIDEVHMLSQGAFNALLKTLEEPPEHVVFILATTEVHKVLPTIISRCQRYDFTRSAYQDIIKNLEHVIKSENIKVEKGVVEMIATLADGGHRDSLTILEQVIAYADSPIKVSDVSNLYRISQPQEKQAYIEALISKDLNQAFKHLEELETKSIDYHRYLFDMIKLCKEVLVYSETQNEQVISAMNLESVKALSQYQQNELILELANAFIQIASEARFNGQYQSYLEVATLNLLNFNLNPISALETQKEIKIEKPVPEVKKVETQELIKEVINDDTVLDEDVSLDIDQEVEYGSFTQEDDQHFIELMVLGDKQQRESDQNDWAQRQKYLSDLKYRRLNFLLNQSDVRISNNQFVTFVVPTKNEVMALLDETNIELFNELVSTILGQRKVYVLEANRFNAITTKFIELMNNKELPDPNQISIDFSFAGEAEIELEPIEDKLKKVFDKIRIED